MNEKRPTEKVTPLIHATYLKLVDNAVGSNMFRVMYAVVNDAKKDIMIDGDFSCAFFVSSVLKIFGQIGRVHATVDSTIKDLKQSGWNESPGLKEGAILVWEGKIDESGEIHKHLGFYLGDNLSVSNSSETKTPQKHHYTYGEINGEPVRKVTNIFWKEKEAWEKI